MPYDSGWQDDHPHYVLRCTHCNAEYLIDSFRLQCNEQHEPALLRAEYRAKTLEVKSHLPGVFRYVDWLPVKRCLDAPGKPITYESKGLSHHLGLTYLYISFNGYWPDRQAELSTGSFKELEAITVLARIPKDEDRTLVIMSAGNTGRAFASLCSSLNLPLYLVIPEKNLKAIWSHQPFSPCVRLIAVRDGDYSDAIVLGQSISQMENFFLEGGAANVARRDGMGLPVIDAAVTLGKIPDHYFQAVGSGTGGIAAWEATQRLLGDGRFGSHRMKLHLAQNEPFTPMVRAWKARSRCLLPVDEELERRQIHQVSATVLTNRNPAYSVTGGLYEALVDTAGEMYAVTNHEADRARHLFETLEGIDICPASGVATAALIQAVEAGKVGKQDCILLNITSGGTQRMQQEHPSYFLQPNWVIPAGKPWFDELPG
ncbi:cysteate synthase [filamentous cyanobacterium CCP2]|nr:cysteate synthase [filamentous cyanobacterium CCP2]